MQCELLAVDSAFNVRDLGGYKTRNSKTIKKRRFIRAGSLGGISPEGVETLLDMGVDCVVDLRSSAEASAVPNSFKDRDGVAYNHIPMLDYIQSNITSNSFLSFPKTLEEMYIGLLDNAKTQFHSVFSTFAQLGYKTTVFHCTAGKDRAGMTAMLLLSLAGVEEDVIVEDYSYSERLIKPIDYTEKGYPAYLFESKPRSIRAAINHLNTHYGGAEEYLEMCGIDKEQRQIIISKLTD